MKKYCLHLLVVFGLILHFQALANPSNIYIKIEGYHSDFHKNFCEISIPDVNYPFHEQIKISEEGEINITLIIPYTREIIFSFESRIIPIITSPDDDVRMKINIQTLLSYKGKVQAEIEGLNKEENRLIYQHIDRIDDWIAGSTNAFIADKSWNEMEYRRKREWEMKGQLEKLNRWISENQISNKIFKSWAQSKIKYAAGTDLGLFPYLGKLNQSLSEDAEYFSFIHDLQPNNLFVASSLSFTEYFERLISSFGIIFNISHRYKEIRNSIKRDSLSDLPYKAEMFIARMDGLQREIALTHLILHGQSVPSSYKDRMNQFLSIDDIKHIDTKNEINHLSILTLLEQYDLKDEEKKPLMDMYQAAEGKIIFHDFWFLNCPPCMAELPHFNDLIHLSGEDIEFIFYGDYMDRNTWSDAISRYQLKGKHHLLNKNQRAFFQKYFKLKGYPHHHLVSKEGIIVNEHLPSVKPENFELILKHFEK